MNLTADTMTQGMFEVILIGLKMGAGIGIEILVRLIDFDSFEAVLLGFEDQIV